MSGLQAANQKGGIYVELVLLQNPLVVTKEEYNVNGSEIGAFQGYFVMNGEERERIDSFCREKYEKVANRAGDFMGHIRFDLVPKLISKPKKIEKNVYDLGLVDIASAYEINSNALACAACTSSLHSNFRQLKDYQPSAAKKLARRIKGKFGGKEIAFVVGDGPEKISWGQNFYQELKETGLNLQFYSPEEVRRNDPDVIWRWGDVRLWGGFTDLDLEFSEWLYEKQRNGTVVFNTIVSSPEKDVGNKKHLLGKEDYEVRSENLDYLLSKEKDNYVLKPFTGLSGNGIVFGKDCTAQEWKEALRSSKDSGYGIYKAKWLPKIDLEEGTFAFDLNTAYWVDENSVDYLYTVARMDDYDRYFKRGTINVAAGAAYGGPVKEKVN